MNVMKYSLPFHEGIGNGPQISVRISSKTFIDLSALLFFLFVIFPLIHSTQVLLSEWSSALRIPANTSLSIPMFRNVSLKPVPQEIRILIG